MNAYIVKNVKGTYNIIVINEGEEYIWDCEITEDYTAVLLISESNFNLIPTPTNVKEKLKQITLNLPEYNRPSSFKINNLIKALEYCEKNL